MAARLEVNSVQVTDSKLISDFVLSNDDRAFEALVVRHVPTIRRVLFPILNGNHSDMEEVEQEILIALYKALPGFEYRASFTTWLYRFCRNKGIDYLRRESSVRKRKMLLRTRLELVSSSDADPAYQVLRTEKRDRVRRVLSQLKERDRSILVMKDMDGLSLREISAIIGLPEGTVKSRLHRARRKAAIALEFER
ncbi:MAG: RNA polymerase sigma factor [Spirochaetales bacterium]|jgi:RNA polymerase sigma-70 factor, ECF subfamily|nr:RNA polymerase sigma factor [Spirochaetales bacterium]